MAQRSTSVKTVGCASEGDQLPTTCQGSLHEKAHLEERSWQVKLLATNEHLCSLALGIFDVTLHLVDSSSVDERAVGDALSGSLANFEGANRSAELFGEGVVDAILDEDAVGADAGLSRKTEGRREVSMSSIPGAKRAPSPELGDDNSRHGLVDVGIIEHNEGSVSTELQAELLQCRSRLLRQDLAHPRRAREGDLVDLGVLAELLADLGDVLIGEDAVDHAVGHASLAGDLDEGEDRERGLGRRFDDYRAASSESSTKLASDHGGGEVPGGDCRQVGISVGSAQNL